MGEKEIAIHNHLDESVLQVPTFVYNINTTHRLYYHALVNFIKPALLGYSQKNFKLKSASLNCYPLIYYNTLSHERKRDS